MEGEIRLSEKIKSLRKKLGMSQTAFAERFQIPVSTIRDWEQSRRTPPPYVVHLLSEQVGEIILCQEDKARMNQMVFSFVVYMIHACADNWQKTPSEVYQLFKKSGCVVRYLVPNYEILHTQGTDTVVEDLREYLQKRGEAV